jgi:hypothetical protein
MGKRKGVSLRDYFEALREDDKRELTNAFNAAKEKSASHNDLIREGQRKEASYVTKAELYAALIAVTAVITAATAILRLFIK